METICMDSIDEMLKGKLTAKNDVSFQIALSRLLFALLPRNKGSVRKFSKRFISSSTLFVPVVSVLYRDLAEPLRS